MPFSLEQTSPTRIKKSSPQELLVVWADAHETTLLAPVLRGMCPCAHCQDEMTGIRRVLPIHIPDDLELRKLELVGQYALQIEFSDGHRTGIYSFQYLRQLCGCAACKALASS